MQADALVLNNLDMVMEDEVLNQLETEDALASEFCQLSLNAIAGTEGQDCIKVRALVENQVMIILIDSGSSHSFVSNSLVTKINMKTASIPASQVKVANGEVLIIDGFRILLSGLKDILFIQIRRS